MHPAEYREVLFIGVPLNQSIYRPAILQNGFKIDKRSPELCPLTKTEKFLFGVDPVGASDRVPSFLDFIFLTKDFGDLDLKFEVTAAL